MKPYTIFVDGISKALAATGVRVGWSMGPADVIARMKALLSHLGAWSPMAEQKATAAYLLQKPAIQKYLAHYKGELEERLTAIYKGFIALKEKGYRVDAVAPQAAIYLTIQLNLAGKAAAGKLLEDQSAVTDYILDKAKLAVVPFYAFGASRQSPWYRLSVGTCKKEEIPAMLAGLESALALLQ
jgi:aspartate aminotransferase